MTEGVFAIVMAAILSSAWVMSRVVRGPIGEALGRRLGGSPTPSDEAELSELRGRLAELEERVDFTERVLLQERNASQLGEGSNRP
jgi:hypothetical protein